MSPWEILERTSYSPNHLANKKEITLFTLNLTFLKHIPLDTALILAAVHISRQRKNNHLP